MPYTLDTFDFTYEGRNFRAYIEDDEDSDPPWENSDGHGPVSDWTSRDKHPGEWVLNADSGSRRYYDVQQAMVLAKRDGWGLSEEQLTELTTTLGRWPPTEGEIRAAAVRRDFEYLRGWCQDEWHYVGVCVCVLDEAGDPVGNQYDHALWGVESNADDYLREVASELAAEILHEESRRVYPVNTVGV